MEKSHLLQLWNEARSNMERKLWLLFDMKVLVGVQECQVSRLWPSTNVRNAETHVRVDGRRAGKRCCAPH